MAALRFRSRSTFYPSCPTHPLGVPGAYVAAFLGERGGEFRFAVDLTVPEALLPAGIPTEAGHIAIPPPVVQAGLWLRVPF